MFIRGLCILPRGGSSRRYICGRNMPSKEDEAGCACVWEASSLHMVLARGKWVDGPASLADSLAESAQVEDTDRLEEDLMGSTCVERES